MKMKAIKTKYYGPTNHRGSRMGASDEDGNSLSIEYDARLNAEENHAQAALSFLKKMGWKGTLIGGFLKDSMVWVFEESTYRVTNK